MFYNKPIQPDILVDYIIGLIQYEKIELLIKTGKISDGLCLVDRVERFFKT